MEFKVTRSWDSYLDHFPDETKDLYFEESYVKLYEDGSNEAVCFVCNSEDKYLIFPFLRRRFEFKNNIYYDFETAYGYGGPLSNFPDDAFIFAALKLFYEYCTSNNYIAGFVRFHPLLNNISSFDSIGCVNIDRQTIAIDLTLQENEIWMREITVKNRSTIKKAIGNQLRFVQDDDFHYFDDFIRLYKQTMSRLGADDFFIFHNSYYDQWKKHIKNSFLGVVLYQEKVVSAAMFFYSKNYGHYHLSGSDLNYLSLGPNNLMLWEASKVLKAKGVKAFHLGGGSNADENNSLFQFKARFSKERYNFFIGKIVFNEEIYHQLCLVWENKYPEKAFLKNHLLKYKY